MNYLQFVHCIRSILLESARSIFYYWLSLSFRIASGTKVCCADRIHCAGTCRAIFTEVGLQRRAAVAYKWTTPRELTPPNLPTSPPTILPLLFLPTKLHIFLNPLNTTTLTANLIHHHIRSFLHPTLTPHKSIPHISVPYLLPPQIHTTNHSHSTILTTSLLLWPKYPELGG